MPATPTECSVSRKAGFMLQILPCWSTVNIGKLMLSMFIVSPPCDGMHRVLAGCSESVRWGLLRRESRSSYAPRPWRSLCLGVAKVGLDDER